MTDRKPLAAQFVGKTNEAAKKALGDVKARRKWADSSAGSPITTNMLCAEIARLNLERDAITNAIKDACNLLAERNPGNPARSPGHNARLLLEAALASAK